jgi:predicted oxidoreductase
MIASELSRHAVPTLIVEQGNANNVGSRAFRALGGLFCVDCTEQRRLGIQDSRTLAMRE